MKRIGRPRLNDEERLLRRKRTIEKYRKSLKGKEAQRKASLKYYNKNKMNNKQTTTTRST
jgi:hypothetical protein